MGFLTGKTVIITGGGRAVLSDGRCGSIGYGIATAFAKEGANLVLTGRNLQKLLDAKEELERLYGVQVLPLQADISAEMTDSRQVSVISSAAVHQDKPKERSDEFALRICYTTGCESCWDIAKRCGTTVEAVMEENEITDRNAELSGMVVIPIV